jgi:nucleotide-binding universal stress UspA family protein
VAEELRLSGLRVDEPIVRDGDPKHLLLEEANAWGADCIFVGARGLSRMQRVLLGSVSGAVAARAECSVEVIRPNSIAPAEGQPAPPPHGSIE